MVNSLLEVHRQCHLKSVAHQLLQAQPGGSCLASSTQFRAAVATLRFVAGVADVVRNSWLHDTASVVQVCCCSGMEADGPVLS